MPLLLLQLQLQPLRPLLSLRPLPVASRIVAKQEAPPLSLRLLVLVATVASLWQALLQPVTVQQVPRRALPLGRPGYLMVHQWRTPQCPHLRP